MLTKEQEIKRTIVLRSLTGGEEGLKKFPKVPYVISERSLRCTSRTADIKNLKYYVTSNGLSL